MNSESQYERRGVSFTKEEVHRALKYSRPGLYPDTFSKILADPWDDADVWACLLHADTAGTKPVIAYLYWKETGSMAGFESVVQDALVMNTDDMACAGCTGPFVVSATLGRNKKCIPGEVVEVLIRSAEDFASHMAGWGLDLLMAGGETADVGDIIRTLDVGYTLMGRLRRQEVLHIRIQPGDVVVGFSSSGQCLWENSYNSGIGSNGLTSARHDLLKHDYYHRFPESRAPEISEDVAYQGTFSLSDRPFPDLPDLGSLLLSPTRTYVPLIRQLFRECGTGLHGLIHCTGGGQTKVNKFLQGVRVIKDNLLPLPPIFELLLQTGKTPLKEMFQVFNMGHRLEAYLVPEVADIALHIAREMGIEAAVIGSCTASSQPGVEIRFRQNVFEYPVC
ncbi:MAG: AIR synthase-related protein [Flavobacteriales bacterium]|nr:AIR synthase-related protein [Flavobacteriales bacterium]MDW8431074.1 AIR synthase-related protein [Flavobacteriales bacterium]